MNSPTKIFTGLLALGVFASPVKALTEEGLSIRLQLASCFGSGCYYHRQPQYRQFHDPCQFQNQYYYNPPFYQQRYSNPSVIIIPAPPRYHISPPYNRYHFERDRYRFNHNFNYGYIPRSLDVRVQINQIYRDILGRDADIGGLNTYQDRYNNGWSLVDIQRDIANSQEARSLRGF